MTSVAVAWAVRLGWLKLHGLPFASTESTIVLTTLSSANANSLSEEASRSDARDPRMKRYMVIEHFAAGAKDKVYERFHEKGRMLPDGLVYIDSWLEKAGDRCFQLMETHDPSLFDRWTDAWKDLVRFEIVELGEKPA
jgi:hypothetical protein